jgi:nucleolar protein 56
MYYLAVCIAGLFVLDENKKLVEYRLFEKSPRKIAESLIKLKNNESLPELEELRGKYKLETDDDISGFFKDRMREFIGETGFVKSEEELNRIINEVSIEFTKLSISSISKRDKIVIQAVSALEDTDKTLNQMSERLREWHSLNFPRSSIADHEKFAESVLETNADFLKSSSKVSEKDFRIIKRFAEELKRTFELRKEIESYLEKVVPEEIPNISALLGPILAARLLAKAGSLEKLAKLPSSAVQLLGAEKSLFKYLKGKEKMKGPPKFGVIFVHPDIQTAPKEIQGKIARLLSAKLTVAARADFYSKKDMTKELLEDYKRKLSEIK